MKRIACVFLSLMLVSAMIVGMTGQAATLSHGDYQYTLNEDGTAALTKYLGSQKDLILPDSLDGHPLTGIGNNAFYQSPALCSVMLPAGVKAIGASAFALCPELETVLLPEGLERIGYSAFFQCPFLKEVSLPATLLEIQRQAFSNCEGLTEISVDPRNETWKAIDGVLFSKDGSQLHTYPAGRADASYAIPEGTQVIAGGAFYGAAELEKVTLSGSLRNIGAYAFTLCRKLRGMSIPDGVTRIGTAAFYCCLALQEITVTSGNTRYEAKDGVLFQKDPAILHSYPCGRPAGPYSIPEGTVEIGPWSFANCGVTELSFPDSLTVIREFAFLSCAKFTSLSLPASLVQLDQGAFAGCMKLENLTLQEGLETIGASAFHNTVLKFLTIPDSVQTIGGGAFTNCPVVLTVGEGSYALTYAQNNGIPYTIARR